MNDKNQTTQPGPTGKFPLGKLCPSDDGELAVRIGIVKDKIVMEFGIPITFLAITKDQAGDLSKLLLDKANLL